MTEQDFDNFVFDFNSIEDETLNGDKIQVMRFSNALVHEKKYMNAIKKYGLDSPMTYKSRHRLDVAIKRFEKEVGINWPLK